jgi:hypothetical protein
MPNHEQEPIYSSDAQILTLDPKDGIGSDTPRPLTGDALKRAQEFVARREELRRLAEEEAKRATRREE